MGFPHINFEMGMSEAHNRFKDEICVWGIRRGNENQDLVNLFLACAEIVAFLLSLKEKNVVSFYN